MGKVMEMEIWEYVKEYLDELHLESENVTNQNICAINSYLLENFPISYDLLDVKQLSCLCKASTETEANFADADSLSIWPLTMSLTLLLILK